MRERLPLVFSTAALLVALLGAAPLGKAAYQAVVPRNSVGTLQLKRNAVTSSKIAPNAIRTGQIVDGSLLSGDFKAGQIPQGPKGDKGDKGSKGDRGPSDAFVTRQTGTTLATTGVTLATLPLTVGKYVIDTQIALDPVTPGAANVSCGISVGGSFLSETVSVPATGIVQHTLHTFIDLKSDGAAVLNCSGPASILGVFPTIIAVKVATLTQS